MSISEREAEQAYPPRYWEGFPNVKKVSEMTSDDLQEAYIRGREAPPTTAEVEAAACWLESHMSLLAGSAACFIDTTANCEEIARGMLDAARKKVIE